MTVNAETEVRRQLMGLESCQESVFIDLHL